MRELYLEALEREWEKLEGRLTEALAPYLAKNRPTQEGLHEILQTCVREMTAYDFGWVRATKDEFPDKWDQARQVLESMELKPLRGPVFLQHLRSRSAAQKLLEQLEPRKQELEAILNTLPQSEPLCLNIRVKPFKPVQPPKAGDLIPVLRPKLSQLAEAAEREQSLQLAFPYGETAWECMLRLSHGEGGQWNIAAGIHHRDSDMVFSSYLFFGTREEAARWLQTPNSCKDLAAALEQLYLRGVDHD